MHYELRIVRIIKHELHQLILLDRGAFVPQITTGMNPAADLTIYLTIEFVISHICVQYIHQNLGQILATF